MTKAEYLEYHKQFCDQMMEITKRKNSDYTGANTDDPFFNFTRVEGLGIASTELGFLVRMTDKISRVISFAQTGSLLVKDESVQDTLLDLANYSVLMAAYLQSKKSQKK